MAELDLSALYDKAREADIEAVAGVRLFRAGRRIRGECPLCGASKGKKAGGAFSADPQARLFTCFGCGVGGDVIDLEQLLRGGTPREAAERLAGPAPARAAPAADRPRPERPPISEDEAEIRKRRFARELWMAAGPAAGSRAEIYLRARGIGGRVLKAALASLRFHPAAPWDGPERAEVRMPAMLALVRVEAGTTGGLHVTHLAADGRSKTHKDPAKRMWGPQGRDGRPGGAWLIGPEADWAGGAGPLIVAEGIENALSAAMLFEQPCRVAAALSLGRLQGGWLPDRFGRYDVDVPRADPEAPAFTWSPPADAPWPEVMIALDRDMKPIRRKVRGLAGKTVERELAGEQRAQVCGALAAQHWTSAGAAKVTSIAPTSGRDFNDMVRGVA